MLFATRPARSKSFRSTVAGFAVAIALAGGASVGSAALTTQAAFAQELPDPSEGFTELYNPTAAMVQPDVADFQGARAQIPALVAAIENNRDRDLAGNLILNIGTSLEDRGLQRQGLLLRLQGGMVAPEQVGLFNWYVGTLSYDAEDWDMARQYLQAARDAGYQPANEDPVRLIAQTYMEQDQPAEMITYLRSQIAASEGAGVPVNQLWLLQGLQTGYDYDMSEEALVFGEMLVRDYPTSENWRNTLQMVRQLNEFESQERVDLYRLMVLQDALVERSDVTRYIEDLDPRVMSNEVQRVLALGLETGIFDAADPYYSEVRTIVEARAPQDRRGIEGIIAEGQSGDALDALTAGDVLLSLEDYARAETMFGLAQERGFDANTANTRIGIAQAQQGNYAQALETFAMVSGNRSPIARLWAAYSAQMMAN